MSGELVGIKQSGKQIEAITDGSPGIIMIIGNGLTKNGLSGSLIGKITVSEQDRINCEAERLSTN